MPEEYMHMVRNCSALEAPSPDAPEILELEAGDLVKLLDRNVEAGWYKVAWAGEVVYVLEEDAIRSTASPADDQREYDEQSMEDGEEESSNEDDAGRRYGALNSISTALQIFGWLTIVLGVLGSVAIAIGTANAGDDNGVLAFASLIGGVALSVISGVILLAVSDLLLVLIDIEWNTRATAHGRMPG